MSKLVPEKELRLGCFGKGYMARFKLVVFDGDDTLWQTMALYRAAKLTFAKWLSRQGFDGPSALPVLEEIDLRNVGLYGFSPKRFPQSMAETYRRLAETAGRESSPEITEEARAIGLRVFEQSPELVDGAKAVLSELAEEHELVLCTKGDRSIQEGRIASSGLASLFSRIYIPAVKGPGEFSDILAKAGIDADHAISVGDSVRSDINPAIEVGMSAIWVPSDNWILEEAAPVESPRLFRAPTLRAVPRILAEAEAEHQLQRSA